MLCPICQNEEAISNPTFGVLPCQSCTDRHSQFPKPQPPVEFTTEAIRVGRKEYDPDTVQPFRGGVFSREYYEKHGTKGVNVTKEDIKGMKNVWKDTRYYE